VDASDLDLLARQTIARLLAVSGVRLLRPAPSEVIPLRPLARTSIAGELLESKSAGGALRLGAGQAHRQPGARGTGARPLL
jgi:hypothetical protein